MSRFKLSDFSKEVQAKIRAQLGPSSGKAKKAAPVKDVSGLTATERTAYDALVTLFSDVEFEGESFELPGGNIYTPDFVVRNKKGEVILAFEIKGDFKLGSTGRSRLAFNVARELNPAIRFFWLEKVKNENRFKIKFDKP
jgi:hypothetical protein